MSISTYAELQTAVGNWLNRADLTSYIPDFIAFGEARVYRELRIRTMETAYTGTISAGAIAVPADYAELKYFYIDGSPIQFLQRKSAVWIYENYPTRSADGKPKFVAQDAGNFIFGPYPDSAYTVKGTYYKRMTALATTSPNWFTTNAPGILLFAALCEAEVFLKNDPRIQLWQAKYDQEKEGIEREERSEQFSGGPLTMSRSDA